MPIPEITVCIPTYNRAPLLQEALKSVLNQTYPYFEIVVSDDASTDNTAEVVAGFKDKRIRYHRQPTNIGITANWEFVFSQAQTEFVAPLADDDLYAPEHLKTALNIINRYPQAAYGTCPAEYFGEGATGFYRPRGITDTQSPLIYCPPEQTVNFLGIDTPGPMNCMLCRKSALKKSLFWGPPGYLPQDLLIMPQLMTRGGFVFSNRSTALFRVHETNTSFTGGNLAILRFNCMVWYGVRWLAQFMLNQKLCTLADIEKHGCLATHYEHVTGTVLGLGSFDSPPALYEVAKRIFRQRTDVDQHSARFRLARRFGFGIIPFAEKMTQLRVGWRP